MSNDNLKYYKECAGVPEQAQKPIKGGRLKGMTDINPMWRLKKLTEMYGPVGFGWYYNILEERLEQGANGEIGAFVKVELFVKVDGEWSMGIQGTGGNMFVTKESKGLRTNDECFKMALTDALSVSCKSIGMGSTIYWSNDNTKYNDANTFAVDTDEFYKLASELGYNNDLVVKIIARFKANEVSKLEEEQYNWLVEQMKKNPNPLGGKDNENTRTEKKSSNGSNDNKQQAEGKDTKK